MSTSFQSTSSSAYVISIPKQHQPHNHEPLTHHHHLHFPHSHFKMGILRSQTTRNITSAPKAPKEDEDIKMGITRSVTDPASEEFRKKDSNNGRGSGNNSGHSSGTSSPRRKTNSMDIVRNIRDRPSSAIPRFHVLAEQVHRFKMRNCPGMEATAEEQAGIKEMKRWSWKSCGHPGACPPPVGPKGETWNYDAEVLNP